MKLLIDEAFEMNTSVVEELNEATGVSTKNYYIHGTFSTPDKKNRNGRVYSAKLWESNVAEYQNHIKENTKYTLGELEHPTRVDPDPMLAVMKIVELKMEDGVVKGKAKILNDNSKETNKLKALIDEGYKIGVSSRGTGRMKGSIVEEFKLSTYDIVQSPSDYNAMLSGISESTETNVHLNESTGHYVCDASGCSLQESKPRDAYSEKELKSGIKELKELLKKHGDKKDIAGVLNMQIERLEVFLKMGKEYGFGIKESIDANKPPAPSPCSLNATSLIESLNNYTQEETVLSHSEQLAIELVEGNKSTYSKAEGALRTEIKAFIKTLTDMGETLAAKNFDRMFTSKILPFTNALKSNISEAGSKKDLNDVMKKLAPLQKRAMPYIKKGDFESPAFKKVQKEIQDLYDEYKFIFESMFESRSKSELESDLISYQDSYKRAKKSGDSRKAQGAQEMIDKTKDKLTELKGK